MNGYIILSVPPVNCVIEFDRRVLLTDDRAHFLILNVRVKRSESVLEARDLLPHCQLLFELEGGVRVFRVVVVVARKGLLF